MGANQRDCTKYVIFRDIDGATDLFSMGDLSPSIPCILPLTGPPGPESGEHNEVFHGDNGENSNGKMMENEKCHVHGG